MPGGRPTKFTPEVITTILECIDDGMPLEASCDFAGVSYRVFAEWRQEGEEAGEGPKWQFAQDVKKALASCCRDFHRQMRRGARDWTAAAWWLERRYRKDYGKNTYEDDRPMSITFNMPPRSKDVKGDSLTSDTDEK